MTLDSNILIAYLGGEKVLIDRLTLWRESGATFFLPTVVETEVLSFAEFSDEERISAEKFLENNFASITFDRNLARIAAEIRRKVNIKFPDAAIAATAIYTQTPVVTRNQKDFLKVPEIKIITI